jgi:ketose-bisphosphate aldolase
MPLVSLPDLLNHALREGYGVGYFEAWDSYSLEAVLEAAEEEGSPVILGFGGMMADTEWLDDGGVELLGAMGRVVAQRARVPVSLLLNEAQSFDQAVRGMEAGFNAVMLDTSAWEWEEAVEAVARLARLAHARGVAVEAEVGRLPDATADGIDASCAQRTDQAEAAAFLAATGVDCLAVAVGNVHLLTDQHAPVDLALLEAIHEQVSVPLVLHGGTGLPPDCIPAAIACGVAKFNVGTILKQRFLQGLQESVARGASIGSAGVSVHDLLGSHKEADLLVRAKAAMKAAVCERIRLYGGSGRASGGETDLGHR